MLSSDEVHKLFNLLEQLHQGKKKPRDKITLAIWAETLKPWTYEQVRDAAIRRSRAACRFFPDPSELAEYLPPVAAPAPCMKTPEPEVVAELRKRWLRLRAERRKAGVPESALAARAVGMNSEQWASALEANGLDLCAEVMRT